MAHIETGVFVEEAEETVEDILHHHDFPQDLTEEAERLCEEGDPITAIDILVKYR